MNNKYLKHFCNAISSDKEISSISFINLYENSITHFTPYLKTEIQENILVLDSHKHNYYFDYVISELKNTPFFPITDDYLDKELIHYNENISNFPYFNKGFLYNYLNSNNVNYFSKEPIENHKHLQLMAFGYASMLEAKKMIEFVEEEKTKLTNSKSSFKKIKWLGKPSQLGYIIGVLADLEYIDAPKRKTNDINYTQFAKQIKNIFEIDTTQNTLSKYLNLNSDKGEEIKRTFEKEKFYIPNRKIVS